MTSQDIIDLLPDDLLTALTDDSGGGAIKTALIDKIITEGSAYVQGVLPTAVSGVQDEALRNYVISKLYSYAGDMDTARQYMDLCLTTIQSHTAEKKITHKIKVESSTRNFTTGELDKW